ncbi:hypothetical protein MYX78_10140 [Acidobacteria bacterium AH-259-G07]|nr:hypothetical protein [Acidobacteria bacterium AH-259-G07]
MTDQIPPHVRIYHCFGGLRLVVESPDGSKQLYPTQKQLVGKVDVPELVGGIVGVDFLTHRGHIEGFSLPEWRVSVLRQDRTPWIVEELYRLLQSLKDGAYEKGKRRFAASCRQVRFHLNVCDYNLRALSDAYLQQLSSLLARENEWDTDTWVTTQYTVAINSSVYAFLHEGCVLRDVLARTLMRYVPNICEKRCSSLSALLRNWSSATESKEPLIKIRQIVEKANTEWIRQLGAYRDCYVHDIPLQGSFSSTKQCENQGLRFIEHYVPDNPTKWRAVYGWDQVQDQPSPIEEEFRAHFEHFSSKEDALKYCHSSLLSICDLLTRLMPLISPVPPSDSPPKITPPPGSIRWRID